MKSYYDLIIEIHYTADQYKVIYYNDELIESMPIEGQLSGSLAATRKNALFHEDAERYYEFWGERNIQEFMRQKSRPRVTCLQYRINTKKGYRWMEETLLRSVYMGHQGGFFSLIRDITEEKDNPELNSASQRDHFLREQVALPDINAFYTQAEALWRKDKSRSYVMFASDLDNFKLLQGIYGEEAGTRSLVMVAEEIRKFCKDQNAVGCYVGDDFFALFSEYEGDIVSFAEKFVAEMDVCAKVNHGFTQTIGIYVLNGTETSVLEMYERAFLAASSIRNDSRRRYAFYRPDLQLTIMDEENQLEEIRSGIKEREFTFYVQPVVDIHTDKIVSSEALVRWVKDGSIISPASYMPLLEKTGYVVLLDCYVWEYVFQRQSVLLSEGTDPLPCSVNVSRADFRYINVAERFLDLADKYNVAPRYVGIEITESAYSGDYEAVTNSVKQLREAGFKIYLDDFGSGYSSLNTLGDMHVDVLKLDMKFAQNVDNKRTVKIMESIVEMAHLLNLPVIVEGVETQRQMDVVRSMGLQYVQGFYYFRPMRHEELEARVHDRKGISEDMGFRQHFAAQVRMTELFDPNVYNDTLLNHILGPIAFLELTADDKLCMVRANEMYFALFGEDIKNDEDYSDHLGNYYDDLEQIYEMLETAYRPENRLRGASAETHYRSGDGRRLNIHNDAFFVGENVENGIRRFMIKVREESVNCSPK